MFRNRSEAGRLLAEKLSHYKDRPGILLAVPRGGVPVAYEVAKELNFPLEVVLVKKLGHPQNKEYAIGAVGLSEQYIVPHEKVTDLYIQMQTEIVRSRLQEMKRKFMGDKEPADIRGQTVIVIDDGVATGNTLIATVRILKRSHPARIVVATPVISPDAAEKLEGEVDELVALLVPEFFYGVGRFYQDFTQLTDEEVIDYLQKLDRIKRAG